MKKVVYLWCERNTPFYVGKGDIDRPYSWKNRNKRIVNKRRCCEKNGTFNIFIVSSGLSNEYACSLERSIIRNNPQLYNYTFGGDGGDTFTKLSEEQKIRKRKLLSNAALKRKEELTEIGKKFGRYVVDNKLGAHSYSSDKLQEWGSLGGKKAHKITNSQRWICLISGYVSTAAGVVSYQKKRGIDTSLRKRLDNCTQEPVK